MFDAETFYLVDLPGYGYAKTSKREHRGLQVLVREYLVTRSALAGVVWLLDVRRDPSPDDLAVSEILGQRQLPVLVAVTKGDKFGRGRRTQRARAIMDALGIPFDQCVITSAHTGDGIEDLRQSILYFVAPATASRISDRVSCTSWRTAPRRKSDGMRMLPYLRTILRLGMALVAWIGLTAPGCARAQVEGRVMTVEQDPTLPPAGYGTLRQDNVSIRMQAPGIQIQIVPLDEHVIRLLANDTYSSLHRLAESKREEIESAAARYGARAPRAFLVTFFGLEREARFDPDAVTIDSQSRLFRPLATIPLSPLWSARQLNQRETAMAIYVFEDGVRLADRFTVEYNGVRNSAWEQILRVLDSERSSVLARASADQQP